MLTDNNGKVLLAREFIYGLTNIRQGIPNRKSFIP